MSLESVQYSGGYVQSKWVAEKLIMQAEKRGLPTNVFRPGLISWHTTLGTCNLSDWFSRLFLGCIYLGLFSGINTWSSCGINLVPVDYVSAAVAAVSLSEHTNQIMDLYNEYLTSWNEMGTEWMASVGKKKLETDCNERWRRTWENIASFEVAVIAETWAKWVQLELDRSKQTSNTKATEVLSGLLLFNNGRLPTDDYPLESRDSDREVLETMGITCPDIEADLVGVFLEFLGNSEQLPESLA
eukprot:TRINITY_DN5779_c0_g1_i1.p1 TRINITY_DN5779_c0_g1~~TRINITY_DN5779_c0_g1_i1.p1  ORF type:complete len:243 (-),score=47.25 TRINITY_DN5779_c0_g1_i1:41-769(-)